MVVEIIHHSTKVEEREKQIAALTGVSIGLATVAAYGYPLDRPVYVESNFATPPNVAIAGIVNSDEPAHEASLMGTALRSGEIGIIPQQVPGVISYWQSIGLVPEGAEIQEIPLHRDGDNGFHFPHTDVVQQAARQGYVLKSGYLTSSFPHASNREAAKIIGLFPVQPFEADVVGDKGAFHENAEKFGYPTSIGGVVRTEEHIKRVYELLRSEDIEKQFAGRPHRIWIKLRNSSGGEGVRTIDDLRKLSFEEYREEFAKAANTFYQNTKLAFQNGDPINNTIQEYWPEGSMVPKEGLVVELDTDVYGPSDGESYSNILYIENDGSVREIAEFVQLVSHDGRFLGSCLKQVINTVVSPDSAMGKVGRYFYSQGVRGPVGTDYKRVTTAKGQMPIFIDPNVRPSMSHHALIAFENIIRERITKGQRISHATFANAVLSIPGGIHHIGDIISALGEYAYTGGELDIQNGCAVPIGVGSYFADGEKIPSNDTRVLIIGESLYQCGKIIAALKASLKEKEGIV